MNQLKIMFLFIFSCLVGMKTAYATEYPMEPVYVSGKILDWESKQPIPNVQLIIFINDAPYADNHGYMLGAYDYPNFPKSDGNGTFKARTRIYPTNGLYKINKVEIIAFKEGYRSERFTLINPQYIERGKSGETFVNAKNLTLFRNVVTH